MGVSGVILAPVSRLALLIALNRSQQRALARHARSDDQKQPEVVVKAQIVERAECPGYLSCSGAI